MSETGSGGLTLGLAVRDNRSLGGDVHWVTLCGLVVVVGGLAVEFDPADVMMIKVM